MEHPDPMVQTAAIRVCESLARSSQSRAEDLLKQFREIACHASEDVLFQIILTLGNLPAPGNRASWQNWPLKHPNIDYSGKL